ncbi:MAG: hypothetical protein ACFBSC_21640 [Microcoleaceae cyanobacterium]
MALISPAQAEKATFCTIDDAATNDYSFQLFDCRYSQSQIQSGKVGFQLDTNLGTLIILSARPGAQVISPHPEKLNDIVVTSWVVEQTFQADSRMGVTIYNKSTGKTVTIKFDLQEQE